MNFKEKPICEIQHHNERSDFMIPKIGNVLIKDCKLFVLIRNVDSQYTIQDIETNNRFIVEKEWFNSCNISDKEYLILRTPYLCAKYYRQTVKQFYKEHKREIRQGIVDFESYKSELFEKVVQQGLYFCLNDKGTDKYIQYKEKIEEFLNKDKV